MYCAYITTIKNLRKHSNADRLLCGECFGNTVIVGFTTDGTPIMASGDNKKVDKLIGDREFSKQYGAQTVFSYGCSPNPDTEIEEIEAYWDNEKTQPAVVRYKPQSDLYVYRMTMTNEDGDVVEYTPDFMRYRCEQMGVKCVPLMCKATIDFEGVHVYAPDEEIYGWPHEGTAGDTIKKVAEKYYDGADPIGKSHIREGVVVRIVNRPKFTAYKHKNFSFKVLEGIVKEGATAPDMEEQEEVMRDNT